MAVQVQRQLSARMSSVSFVGDDEKFPQNSLKKTQRGTRLPIISLRPQEAQNDFVQSKHSTARRRNILWAIIWEIAR